MIHELIARLFQTRDAAHLQHWNTSSDAEHRALEKFYVDSIELIDTFVECYQGAFGKIGVFDLEKVEYDGKIVTLLSDNARWMNENRENICRGISPLLNLLDTIMELHLVIVYRLQELK